MTGPPGEASHGDANSDNDNDNDTTTTTTTTNDNNNNNKNNITHHNNDDVPNMFKASAVKTAHRHIPCVASDVARITCYNVI